MSSQRPKLFVIPWGLYPRRITIYLTEKFPHTSPVDIIPVNISSTGQLEGLPDYAGHPGQHVTVPILEIPNSPYITQSISILEFLEDQYGEQGRDMRGITSFERARGRDLMAIADEITSTFGLYVHSASKLFQGREKQSVQAAEKGLERLEELMNTITGMADPEGPFLVTGKGHTPQLVDCVMLSTIEFARNVYDCDLTNGRERLKVFENAWIERRASVPDDFGALPREIRVLSTSLSVR